VGKKVAPSASTPAAGNRQWLQIAGVFERRLGSGRQAAESYLVIGFIGTPSKEIYPILH